MFRNNNPDKGTETLLICKGTLCASYRLEIITPIRGRKPMANPARVTFGVLFRNNNPDKGTETI